MPRAGATLTFMVPELIAHRGWTRHYVENTSAAVKAALEVGARHVEVDVQLSSDGVPFLFHDRDLLRICAAPGALHERSAAELDDLRACEPERFAERFSEQPLTRLADLVRLFETYPDRHAYIELKRASLEAFGAAAVLDAVLPLLAPLRERCCLISFDHAVLGSARARGDWSVGPVLEHWDQLAGDELIELQPEVVFCNLWRLPDEDPLRVPSGSLAVYEVDEPALALSLAQRGVDLIETFAIGELLAALNPPGAGA